MTSSRAPKIFILEVFDVQAIPGKIIIIKFNAQ